MLSIGALTSAAQGASYYERDGYYAKDDPEHREASAWAGKGAEELGLRGPVDADTFRAVLEGKVPDGSGTRLGRRGKDGEITHRPGRDLTFSAPKSVSLAALIGGDRRIVEAHDRAVAAALDWVERNAAETRMKDPETGRMGRVGNQKTVVATFRHDTSRNLDPQLHTHAVLANMVRGEDGKWRSMANEKLYESKMLLGALYRSELAASLAKLGYGIEKTHADGRFEIAGVPRETIEAFSSRRAEIEAAMEARDLGNSADNPRLAERAALMTRAKKRDIDRDELRERVAAPGGRARLRRAGAGCRSGGKDPRRRRAKRRIARSTRSGHERQPRDAAQPERGDAGREWPAPAARAGRKRRRHRRRRRRSPGRWPISPSARRCSPAPISWPPRSPMRRARSAIGDAEREVAALEKAGTLHAVDIPGAEDSLTTDRTVGEEREAVALMAGRPGPGPGAAARLAGPGPPQQGAAHGRAEGCGEADPVGEGPHGRRPGLCRHRQDHHARPGAHARGEEGLAHGGARALGLGGADARFRGRHRERDPAAVPRPQRRRRRGQAHEEGRQGDARRLREDHPGGRRGLARLHRPGKRDLLRIANALRIPRVVLVGDAKQLDAVDAGKPFAQLQAAGMQTATMDEIMRQRDPALKEAVEASLKGDIERAFEKLGSNVAEVKPDNIAGAVAARWLRLDEEARANTGVMAPSHELRQGINGHIRERLAREGRLHGPTMESERLVSKGYTNAEKALAANYGTGDVVAFHRPYKRIGVEKGDERRVTGVDRKARAVLLDDGKGGRVAWKPEEIGGRRKGGSEVYRAEEIELRAGDRIRWTRNDAGLGLVNSRTAEVLRVANGRVTFRLEDGKTLELGKGDPQLQPSRPCLGVDRARLPGPHGGQRDRRDGGAGIRISPRRRASTSRSAAPATGPSW